jgi:hypothetical protein
MSVDVMLSDSYVSSLRIINLSKKRQVLNIITLANIAVVGNSIRYPNEFLLMGLDNILHLTNLLNMADISYEII